MTLPNLLTLSRIAFAFLLWPLLFWDFIWANTFALATFIIASLTDLFDGQLARSQKNITAFGAIMDPVADKVLILTAFFAFVRLGILPLWLALVIFIREIIVTFLRLWVIQKGIVMPAQMAGKQKTVSQIVAILYVLIFLTVKSMEGRYFSFWNPALELFFLNSSFYLALLAMILTLISGGAYLFDLQRALAKGQK